MFLSEKDYEYLKGELFSDSYDFVLNKNEKIGRMEKIVDLCKGKKVLHVGCCDHLPLIESKIADGTWLQKQLDAVCDVCIGVDINEDAVRFVNEKKYSRINVLCLDMTSDNFSELLRYSLDEYIDFDYIILGEMIEHVDNPVMFLSCVKNNMQAFGFSGKYIITVPNAFRFVNSYDAHHFVEAVNTDHRYWFTPYTISKIACCAGLKPEEIFFVRYLSYGKKVFKSLTMKQKIIYIYMKMIRVRYRYKNCYEDTLILLARNDN